MSIKQVRHACRQNPHHLANSASPMRCMPFVGTPWDEDKRQPCNRCPANPSSTPSDTIIDWSGPVKDQSTTRGTKAPVHEFNAPPMSPCVPNRTSYRKCRIRTPDAIRSMVRHTGLGCPAYPRRQPQHFRVASAEGRCVRRAVGPQSQDSCGQQLLLRRPTRNHMLEPLSIWVNCAAQSAIPLHKQALPSTGRPKHRCPPMRHGN